MTDLERFKVVVYEYLWFEERRLYDGVFNAWSLMRFYENDSHFITKYYEAVRKYEDFKIFQQKIAELLRTY